LDDLTQADIAFIRSSGRRPESITSQLQMLRGGWQSVRVSRAAVPGDGVELLQDHDTAALREMHQRAAADGRVSSFVPASGSGTRMFQSLFGLHRDGASDLNAIRAKAAAGDSAAKDACVVLDNIRAFAIWPELEQRGCSADSLGGILEALFSEGGLQYHELPKGLIPYHRYGAGARTAFAEHLREAAALGTDSQRRCRVHFTVGETHQALFEEAARREAERLGHELQVTFEIGFSVQSPATDAIGVDGDGRVLRDKAGSIAFRPGGHGALLVNLAEAQGDIVLIKNIDNIAREEFQPQIAEVRALISGLLLLVEGEVHGEIRRLRAGGDAAPAFDLLAKRFGVQPENAADGDAGRRAWALAQLDRPIRVCGVVATQEHAGGRPFWIPTPERGDTLQLVEGAEVNMDNAHERDAFKRSGHFNPVDMACSIRDADGHPYDLQQFIVPDRALIARKVVGGVASAVYEHPGLWNGGMGLWNTMFVDVPGFIFNPVKSLADLWTPAHRGPAVD
jgi:hypothetical protein